MGRVGQETLYSKFIAPNKVKQAMKSDCWETFGITKLKPFQQNIIKRIYSKKAID